MKPNKKVFIEIIAPSGKVRDPEKLPLLEAFLQKNGCKPRLGKWILGEHPFLGNTLENRFQDFFLAASSSESVIIWPYRGGSGGMELLPLLSQLSPIPQEKYCLGFSDITALHIFLSQFWGWKTFHGPNASQVIGDQLDPVSQNYVQQFLQDRLTHVFFPDMLWLNKTQAINPEHATTIIGGNLSVLCHLLGTPFQPKTTRKMLLLEEINEPAYKIRRGLMHLQQAGLFQNVSGVLFGAFTHDNINQQHLIMKELQAFAKGQTFPVLQTNTIGHGKQNFIIPLGQPVLFKESFSKLFF